MIDFTLHTQIERAPADVFAYVTDPAKLTSWQTNTVSVTQLTEGAVGLGTRLREVHRAPGGKELVSVVEVSEFEPGRVFALRVVEGTPIHLRIVLDESTRLAFHVHGQLEGAARLLQPVLRRVLKRQFKAQLATLKAILE